jgi:hypothetical protein
VTLSDLTSTLGLEDMWDAVEIALVDGHNANQMRKKEQNK